MDDLLRPVSTVFKIRDETHIEEEIYITEAAAPLRSTTKAQSSGVVPNSPEDALEILKNEPDFESFVNVLKFLADKEARRQEFLVQPSPILSQLVNVFVCDVIPNYWAILSETKSQKKGFQHEQERDNLLLVLRSVTGHNALVTRLKAVIKEATASKKQKNSSPTLLLKDYLEILTAVLEDPLAILDLYQGSQSTPNQGQAIWQEITRLLAGGPMLNTAAEAYSVFKESSNSMECGFWIADGLAYSRWIGKALCQWIGHILENEGKQKGDPWGALCTFMQKAMRLGHPDVILEAFIELELETRSTGKSRRPLEQVILSSGGREKKAIIHSTIKLLGKRYLSKEPSYDAPEWWKEDASAISAVAAFLAHLFNDWGIIDSWLTSLSGAGVGEPVGIRRAVVAVATTDGKSNIETVLEDCLKLFGDSLYIRHTPTLQQDAHAQVLLLAVGCVHRMSPRKLKMLSRSGLYLNVVSNRLASSSSRARWLGMVVGEVISRLVDTAEAKPMNFAMEELQTAEAKWYKSLVDVQDTIGESLKALRKPVSAEAAADVIDFQPNTKTTTKVKKPTPTPNHTSEIMSIEEIETDEEEGEDLIPYGKPDSDAEDSDDDPTLITRGKPTAPVYIRDLISYFRDSENYDKQKLALATAPSLIRRKANFGTEVKDHVEELAAILMGLQDKYDIDNFNELRMQSMIAVLLSDPERMGKWYSKTFFDGDYSVSQRASVLSTITMAGRELGGYAQEDKSLTAAPAVGSYQFPSKRLPDRLNQTWEPSSSTGGSGRISRQLEPNAVDLLTEEMSKAMIQPLAANLADNATGPNILKVRTFSSRLAVESRRSRPSVNNLSKIVADSFFFPLTGRFFAYLKAYGGRNVVFESFLLSSLLKTLSLLLHASGQNTLQLAQMTREYWDLLLAVRGNAVGDKVVGEAVLFGFLSILEINEDKRRLAEQHSREMLETQRWVENYFTTLGAGKEEERGRTLAAGVVYRLREVIEKYQALLMGDMASY